MGSGSITKLVVAIEHALTIREPTMRRAQRPPVAEPAVNAGPMTP
jgi:hypothetical protein